MRAVPSVGPAPPSPLSRNSLLRGRFPDRLALKSSGAFEEIVPWFLSAVVGHLPGIVFLPTALSDLSAPPVR